MIRILIGLCLLTLMVFLTSTLHHNIEYWGTIKSWGIVLGISGFIVLGFNIITKIELLKPASVRMYALKWMLYIMSYFIFLALVVIAVIKLEELGEWANSRLKDYYLSNEIAETQGSVIGEVDIPYRVRYTLHSKRYTLIEYNTNKGIIRQGTDSEMKLTVGDSVPIVYSKIHPSFFKVRLNQHN